MRDLSFSQRNNYEALPTQLKLDELPNKTRYQIADLCSKIIMDNSYFDATLSAICWLQNEFEPYMKHIWIEIFENRPSEFPTNTETWQKRLEVFFEQSEPNKIFDLLELICSWPPFEKLRSSLDSILKSHRTAYSFIDGLIMPSSSEVQPYSFENPCFNAGCK